MFSLWCEDVDRSVDSGVLYDALYDHGCVYLHRVVRPPVDHIVPYGGVTTLVEVDLLVSCAIRSLGDVEQLCIGMVYCGLRDCSVFVDPCNVSSLIHI